jgi:hypothetical protein
MIMERVERSCLGFGLQFRELKLNEALREVCAGWAGCRFDGGHTYRFRFTRAMFSRLDSFHPSLLGQATLAAETWRMSWWGA